MGEIGGWAKTNTFGLVLAMIVALPPSSEIDKAQYCDT